MNISITNECNRRCEFCFQKEWYLSNDKIQKREMTLENIEKILEWAKNSKGRIKVFGGEPLLYSDLQGLFDVFKKFNRKIVFLTNFNVSSDKIDIVMNNIKNVAHMLINCDYNDSQKDQFDENISRLPKKANISIGTTLLPDRKYVDKSIERLLNTMKILNRKKMKIRVAPMTPNFKIKFDNTYDHGDNIIYFMETILQQFPKTIFGFDCYINRCEIGDDAMEQFKTKYKKKMEFRLECCYKHGPALDILVDNSAVWCSSSKFIKVNNVFDYANPRELINVLATKYNDYMQNNFWRTKCDECIKFLNECDGLCASKIV